MKGTLTTIVALFFLSQCSCAFRSLATEGKSRGPDNSKSTVGRIENGQTIRWEKQGITFTLPPDWRKDDYRSADDEKRNETFTVSSLVWKGPRNEEINLIIETGEKDFPVSEREMLEADYRTNQSQKDTIKDSHYEEIDGVNGLYSLVSDDREPISAYWMTYRHRNGKAQSVGLNLRGPRNELDMLMTILKSMKLEHE